MSTRFTLDIHCLIMLEEDRPEAKPLRALAAAHAAGNADVAIVALATPSITSTGPFHAQLEALGLGGIELLQPMSYFDIALADWSMRPTEELEDIEREVHSILYPSVHYAWTDFRKANEIEAAAPPMDSPWRQAKCDVQAILAHIENERDVFVTSAEIFHRDLKKRQLVSLGARAIVSPADALSLVDQS